jgi:hypothetical protein
VRDLLAGVLDELVGASQIQSPIAGWNGTERTPVRGGFSPRPSAALGRTPNPPSRAANRVSPTVQPVQIVRDPPQPATLSQSLVSPGSLLDALRRTVSDKVERIEQQKATELEARVDDLKKPSQARLSENATGLVADEASGSDALAARRGSTRLDPPRPGRCSHVPPRVRRRGTRRHRAGVFSGCSVTIRNGLKPDRVRQRQGRPRRGGTTKMKARRPPSLLVVVVVIGIAAHVCPVDHAAIQSGKRTHDQAAGGNERLFLWASLFEPARTRSGPSWGTYGRRRAGGTRARDQGLR